ncbi:hypothetical protein ABH920_002980 [Catenulispora sp. EB89]|uniref:hypothetical protein n=1 Tax=Catenulispora sp. EB89 TaxID=3156257 RepID=UPI0035161DF7
MEDGSSEDGTSLGTRRLCVAVAGAEPGLLASAVHSAAFDRLYVAATSDGEVAVAPPGMDDFHLIRDLIAVVYLSSLGTNRRFPFILLALDVGLVWIVGDGFGGAGLRRVRSLVSHPAVAEAASRFVPGHHHGDPGLMVVVPPGLHSELLAEGLAGAWHHIPDADAWLWPANEVMAFPEHDEPNRRGHTG